MRAGWGFTAALGLGLAAAPAVAQDMASTNWSGPYVSGFAGWASGKSKTDSSALSPPIAGFTSLTYGSGERDNNVTFGGGGGYQRQYQRFIVGIEADISYTGLEMNRNNPDITLSGGGAPFTLSGAAIAAGGGSFTATQELDWIATIRPRVGYLITPQLAIFGTGGFAFGRGSVGLREAGVFTPGSGSKSDETVRGWTVGLGLEYMLTPQLLLRGEYMYVDVRSSDASIAFAGGTAQQRVDIQMHVPRVGLTWKF